MLFWTEKKRLRVSRKNYNFGRTQYKAHLYRKLGVFLCFEDLQFIYAPVD